MKRLMSITLAVVLVLALGSLVSADTRTYAEGTLVDNKTLEVDIPVHATVGPYAAVWVDDRTSVDFGTLLGRVGIYTANGLDGNEEDEFYHRAKAVFDTEAEWVGNEDGFANFYVESNTDVEVALGFNNTGWLASPTLFGVSKYGGPNMVLAWAASNFGLADDNSTSYSHAFGKSRYGIDGAIWIQNISQQRAETYTGMLTVTVSK